MSLAERERGEEAMRSSSSNGRGKVNARERDLCMEMVGNGPPQQWGRPRSSLFALSVAGLGQYPSPIIRRLVRLPLSCMASTWAAHIY